MSKKTCKIYAYKVTTLDLSLTPTFLKEKFHSKKSKENILDNIRSTDYGAVLTYLNSTKNDGLAFVFTKILNKKQEFIRMEKQSGILNKIKRVFYGNDNEKPIEDSYFIYYPESKSIIGLYNHEGLRHIIGDLQIYLETFLNLEKNSCQFDLIQNTEELTKLLRDVKFVNKIIIKTALVRIDSIDSENPFTQLESYQRRGYRIIEFNHLKTYKEKIVEKISKLVDIHKNANQIIVNGDNISGDILGKLLLHKKCKLHLDVYGKISYDDFVDSAEEYYEKIKQILDNYE